MPVSTTTMRTNPTPSDLAAAHRLGMLRGAGFVGALLLCQSLAFALILHSLGAL